MTNKHVSVKNVQIIPDTTKNKIMKRLQLDPDFRTDADAVPSNFMLLDPFLADAFDCLNISFSPVDMLHTEVFVLKIWDPSCRDDHIEVGITADMQSDIILHGKVLTTIGDYEGFPLNIPFSWKVSRTVLSYHHLCCYMYHKYKDNMSIDDSEPADFTSLEKGQDPVRRQLAEMFHSSIREDHHTRDEDFVSELDYDVTVNDVGVDRKTSRKCIVM